jgi:hypothetical protein
MVDFIPAKMVQRGRLEEWQLGLLHKLLAALSPLMMEHCKN